MGGFAKHFWFDEAIPDYGRKKSKPWRICHDYCSDGKPKEILEINLGDETLEIPVRAIAKAVAKFNK